MIRSVIQKSYIQLPNCIPCSLLFCTALFSLVVTLLIFGVMAYMKLQVTYVYNNFLPFLATSTVFALLLSVFLYIHGRKAPFSERNDAGNTGKYLSQSYYFE